MSRAVMIVCARAPLRLVNVPAIRDGHFGPGWRCSWCGKRVKVVA